MTREEVVRSLIEGAIPKDLQRWDVLLHPNGEVFDVMTERKLTETEEEAIALTANLLPEERIVFHPY